MTETDLYERVLLLKRSGVRGGLDQSLGKHLVAKPNAGVSEELLE